MTVILTVANNKGGVAKSTTTVQTAAALARAGMRVAVVDSDPQGNATRRLGIEWDPANPIPSLSEAISAGVEGAAAGALIGCGWVDESGNPTREAEQIDVVPARFDLINREAEAGTVGAVRRLKKALAGWSDDYDVVLIDSRPDLGHLVQMAFAASDAVIIATDLGYDGPEGAIRVADFVAAHAEDLGNPGLHVGGVVVTRKRNTAEHAFQLEGLVERFGELVWDLRTTKTIPGNVEVELTPAHIPEWIRFSEADSAAVSLSAWGDERGRTTAGLYDQVAAHIIRTFLPQAEAVTA
ncbi:MULTISPECIES: ParA family protein [unclassified Isoptericola]|uniref:ParA family protein n=1 Tax=Isoptericola sp. NPDC056134 TaxID=3345723 RepID=UPI0035EC8F5D